MKLKVNFDFIKKLKSNFFNKKKKNQVIEDIYSDSKKSKKKLTPKKIFSFVWKTVVSLILIFVITMSIVTTALTVYVMNFFNAESGIDLSNMALSYTTFIYAKDKAGKDVEVGKLTNGENRVWVDLETIPNVVKNAFIYTEDERFRQHEGVDWKRTFGAFANLFFNFWSTQQGGSTITQQLVKNITKEDAVEVQRKVTEIFSAMNLEKKYSKDQILEAYLNIIHMGYNTGGVQAAAKLYFDKDVKDLNALEASTLAALTKNPVKNDPIKYPSNNKKRRNFTLSKMYEYGAISKAEYDKYFNQDVTLKVNKTDAEKKKEVKVQNFFVETVISEVINDLVAQKGYTRGHAEQLIKGGGYKIYCTMDMDMQKKLEDKYKDPLTFFDREQKNPYQSAFVVYDYNGNMKAVVGQRGEKTTAMGLNRATQSIRSPGSTIKPLASYSLAMELNMITYSSLVLDKPIPNYSKGKEGPNNYNKGKFLGEITAVQALQRSQNTVPVRLIQKLTPKRSFDFLKDKLGITTLVNNKKIKLADGTILYKDDMNLAGLGIGALTYGFKLNELTSAYQIFVNKGVYNGNRSYTTVVDSKGETIINKNPLGIKAISEDTAASMNKMLQQVVEGPNGTGKEAKLKNMTVVGKTGTSDEQKDLLFIGCTPYYVGGVWLGYDTPKMLAKGTYYSPAKVYNNVMSYLLDGYEKKDFDLGNKLVEKYYCSSTGLLAKDTCPSKQKGYYKASYIPKYCTTH